MESVEEKLSERSGGENRKNIGETFSQSPSVPHITFALRVH